jgi:hypothetical protein
MSYLLCVAILMFFIKKSKETKKEKDLRKHERKNQLYVLSSKCKKISQMYGTKYRDFKGLP